MAEQDQRPRALHRKVQADAVHPDRPMLQPRPGIAARPRRRDRGAHSRCGTALVIPPRSFGADPVVALRCGEAITPAALPSSGPPALASAA